MQGLQQSPGEGAEEQEVQQDGDDCASKLRPQARSGTTDWGTPRAWILLCQADREGLGVGRCFRGSLGQRKALLGTGEVKGARENHGLGPGLGSLLVTAAGAGVDSRGGEDS